MTWNETRKWCLTEYTDIVMVHNENVTYFLKNNLKEKSSSPYYWIGLRKIKETFTWAANGQSVNYENWAPNEPNNNKANENCVELYTSTNNKGKWNDDSCKNKKHPVCHKGYIHFLIALLASVVISVFCGCLFCCSNCRRSKKAVR
ncbi:hypothetical protein cypCar_00045012 [Cyprinus carpio]|nr:hypothetical protein cypCar_00045012 [Cyprinus carpio]